MVCYDGFGNLSESKHPNRIGDLNGDTKSDVLFYYTGDRNWWLGTYEGSQIRWGLVGNTSGFGQIWYGRPFWIGRFSRSDKAQILWRKRYQTLGN